MNKKHIKVVHYHRRLLPLTQNWIFNQIANLDNISIKFYTFTHFNKQIFPFSNLRCVEKDKNNLPTFIHKLWNNHSHWSPHYLYWLLKDRPDIIHAHFGMNGYHILPYARILRIPLITSFYGPEAYREPLMAPIWRKKYRRLFKYGHLFLVEGPVMREKLIDLGCPPEKIIIHHIGIRLEDYEFRLRKPNNGIRLMVCGRFVEKKGISYAIKAFSRVRSKVKNRVTLTIVGDSNEKRALTKEKGKILNAVKKFRVSGSVKFTGYVLPDEVKRIAYKHHIFLNPSIHASDGDAEGGFPVTITEMLATGMPVVAFAHCDIPHIVKDGKNGFLAPEGDINAFVNKLKYLIEHPKLWPTIGRYGRKLVEKDYNINKLNLRLVKIYQGFI